jgi:hypothetical protein
VKHFTYFTWITIWLISFAGTCVPASADIFVGSEIYSYGTSVVGSSHTALLWDYGGEYSGVGVYAELQSSAGTVDSGSTSNGTYAFVQLSATVAPCGAVTVFGDHYGNIFGDLVVVGHSSATINTCGGGGPGPGPGGGGAASSVTGLSPVTIDDGAATYRYVPIVQNGSPTGWQWSVNLDEGAQNLEPPYLSSYTTQSVDATSHWYSTSGSQCTSPTLSTYPLNVVVNLLVGQPIQGSVDHSVTVGGFRIKVKRELSACRPFFRSPTFGWSPALLDFNGQFQPRQRLMG